MKYVLSLLLILIFSESSFSQSVTEPTVTLPTRYVDQAILELQDYDLAKQQIEQMDSIILLLERRIELANKRDSLHTGVISSLQRERVSWQGLSTTYQQQYEKEKKQHKKTKLVAVGAATILLLIGIFT